jgi:PTH1 family peptidyl-tRNA hydrolase
MKLIVGLGNVGRDYARNRHNVGFMAVDTIAHKAAAPWGENKKVQGYEARFDDVLLLKPTTMMNRSGQAVRAAMDYYQLEPADITIIHDDADLPLGEVRQAPDQSSTGAGHHGVLSVIEHIGSSFHRIRIGIGRPDQQVRNISKYVLTDFAASEQEIVRQTLETLTLEESM